MTTPRRARAKDATALLEADHKAVKKLFRQFERGKDEMAAEDKRILVERICTELRVHTQLEEEIFYPAVRAAIDDEDLLDEASVEHDSARQLIEQLQSMEPDEPLYDAKVTVLGEYVNHHVEEEEGEMFRKARSRKAQMDLAALGEQMAERKSELQGEDADAAPAMPTSRTRGRAGASRNAQGARR